MGEEKGTGVSPWINARQLPVNWLTRDEVPPVAWLERAVSLAVRVFFDRTRSQCSGAIR